MNLAAAESVSNSNIYTESDEAQPLYESILLSTEFLYEEAGDETRDGRIVAQRVPRPLFAELLVASTLV